MDLAQTYLQTQVIGIPKVLVHIICAYYEPQLSDLVKRFLKRHDLLHIPVVPRCSKTHLFAEAFGIYSLNDQCHITFRSHRVSGDSHDYTCDELVPFTAWDEAELNFPSQAMCWCKASQLNLIPAAREMCLDDWRREWINFSKRVAFGFLT